MNYTKIFALLQIIMICLVAIGHRKRLAFWGFTMQKGWAALIINLLCCGKEGLRSAGLYTIIDKDPAMYTHQEEGQAFG